MRDRIYGKENDGRKRVLIYGAGDKGNLAAMELQDRVKIIGFLDDDHTKRNKKIQEFKVMGNRYDIEVLSKIYKIGEVILAVSKMDDRNINHIISICNHAKVNCSMFTTIVDSYMDRLRKEFLMNKKTYNWMGGQECRHQDGSFKIGRDLLGKEDCRHCRDKPFGNRISKECCENGSREIHSSRQI